VWNVGSGHLYFCKDKSSLSATSWANTLPNPVD
jgi:hypothetical protein